MLKSKWYLALKRIAKTILPTRAILYIQSLHYYKKSKYLSLYIDSFKDKDGLEIAGPTANFRGKGSVPIYDVIASLDCVNFSDNTVWQGQIAKGNTYLYTPDKPMGYQYIMDATDLSGIPSEKYDFIISSHNIEHIANPLKALYEWLRVIKKDGLVLIIAPNKHLGFDHRRETTTFAHILKDYAGQVTEHDLTHLDEFLKCTDLILYSVHENPEDFKASCLDNYNNRRMHHHVFDEELLKEIYDHIGLKTLNCETIGQSIIILGKKKQKDIE